MTTTVERMLGRFVDAAWAYRFGPPAQDVIVASVESADGSRAALAGVPVSRRVAGDGRPRARSWGSRRPPWRGGRYAVRVRSRQLAYAVRVDARGFVANDDAFSVEPGGERMISLRPADPSAGDRFGGGTVTALNALDGVRSTSAQRQRPPRFRA